MGHNVTWIRGPTMDSGIRVSAKKNGNAYQFVNRSQAEKHAEKLGADSRGVIQPMQGRVFYVKVKKPWAAGEHKQKDMPKSKKHDIKKITIVWHEGHQVVGKNKTYYSWTEFHRAMKKINDAEKGDRAPGTYTKVKVKLEWEDGTKVATRMDLGQKEPHYVTGKRYGLKPEERMQTGGSDYDPSKEDPGPYLRREASAAWAKDHTRLAWEDDDGARNMTATEDEAGSQPPYKKPIEKYSPPTSGEAQRARHKGSLSSPKLPAQKARNNGPGSGWHGETRRHSIAARKGHRRH